MNAKEIDGIIAKTYKRFEIIKLKNSTLLSDEEKLEFEKLINKCESEDFADLISVIRMISHGRLVEKIMKGELKFEPMRQEKDIKIVEYKTFLTKKDIK